MYGFLLLFNSNLSVSQGQKSFWDIRYKKNAVTLKTGIRVREGHWKCRHSIERILLHIRRLILLDYCGDADTVLVLLLIATMGLSRTVSEINDDFGRKSQIFPNPLVLCAPTEAEDLFSKSRQYWSDWYRSIVIEARRLIDLSFYIRHFLPSSKSRDTKIRINIKNPARSNLDIVF